MSTEVQNFNKPPKSRKGESDPSQGFEIMDYDSTIEEWVGEPLTPEEYIPLALAKHVGGSFVYFGGLSIGIQQGGDQIELTDDLSEALDTESRKLYWDNRTESSKDNTQTQ